MERKLYKSCKTLPIENFFRIFDADDYRNLIVGYDDENDEFTLTKEEKEELETIFKNIFYEYSDITKNYKLKTSLKKQILIEEWSIIYLIVTSTIELYLTYKDESLLDLLDGVDHGIDLKGNIEEQIKKINAKMRGLKNKIKIFKLKLAASFNDDKKTVKVDLFRDALLLERNLDLSRSIDPKTTCVLQWVGLVNASKQKKDSYAKN